MTGPNDADGRPLTRAEIDLLVREAMRLEQDLDSLGPGGVEELLDRTPYRVAPMRRPHHPRRPRRSLRGPSLAVVAVVAAALLIWRPFSYHPIGSAPTSPHVYTDGEHHFENAQPLDPSQPVGYDPCQDIPVVLDPTHATKDFRSVLHEAIGEANAASGLRLTYAGTTTLERADSGADGEVIVSFSDPAADAALKGAAAIGGSGIATAVAGERQYYTGGQVTINRRGFDDYDHENQRAIVMHELGHVLGLSHTTSRRELMSADGHGTYHYQHGDLTGLALLGRIPCQ